MKVEIPVTEFAPAERVSIDIIHRQASALSESPLTEELLNAVLNFVFILNQERQIVFASQNCRALLQGKAVCDILGLRPGEALGCIRSGTDGGCGTTEFCRECGAIKAILASLAGDKIVQECHLTRIINFAPEALDLLVYAIPFTHHGERFSIFSVADISHEKRRRALERIFFHDVINSAGGLTGLVDLLKGEAPPAMREDLDLLQTGFQDLLEEIYAQKDLVAAESDELPVFPVPIQSREILNQVFGLYKNHQLAKDKHFILAPQTASHHFTSDPTLLKRVLGNLVKNALEASSTGQTVTLGCESVGNQVRFWVHNPAPMTRQVQLQVFNRSFSTKGVGRGLGTYSVKLLTEKYLHGKTTFDSSPAQGTTFYVTLPSRLETRGITASQQTGARPQDKVNLCCR